ASGVLVADGAMGTELYARGVPFSACFEELNLSRPELVASVHEDYVRAGARVLHTNTFGANAGRLAQHGLEGGVREINLAAVKIARRTANAYVVGAIGPGGAFEEQARALVDAGVDAIAVETMREKSELRAGVLAVDGRVPVIASVALDARGLMA